MDHIVHTDALAWQALIADRLEGYEVKPAIIGNEYTDAYSVDLVRVAPGGFSSLHVDAARHAFFILEGEARIELGPERFVAGAGAVVKIPPGVPHGVRNDGASHLVFLAIYDPPRRRPARAGASAELQGDPK